MGDLLSMRRKAKSICRMKFPYTGSKKKLHFTFLKLRATPLFTERHQLKCFSLVLP